MTRNKEKHVILLDGGVGQEIYTRAGKPKSAMWAAQVMLDNPEIVKEVHKDFIRAGSTIITINSYPVTLTRLERDGKIDWFEKLQNQAFELADAARTELGKTSAEVAIAAPLPPLYMSYSNDKRSIENLVSEYEKIAAIQHDRVDLFMLETLSCIKEAKAALQVVSKYNKPVFLAFTLDDKDFTKLRSGERIIDALEVVKEYHLDAFLFCCCYPEAISSAIVPVSKVYKSFGGYANLFKSIDPLKPGGVTADLSRRGDVDEDRYASVVMDWVNKGASIVGGCCEIRPPYIKKIHDRLIEDGYTVATLSEYFSSKQK